MLFTSDLLTEIDQHIYETLYVFDTKFHVRPLLAAESPAISAEGTVYTIKLRTGVPFHDGSIMTADDVVTCIRRWLVVSPRGRPVAPFVQSVSNPDARTVVITLKQPYSPLLPLLAYFSAPAVAMPKRLADSNDPVKEYVGTGPYKLIEHAADRYVRMAKFDKYISPAGDTDGMAGHRAPLIDELRFVPVPNPATRAAGLISGEYLFADVLTPESYDRLKDEHGVTRGAFQPPSFTLFVMNTKAGLLSDLRLRRAVQAALSQQDMLTAAFGDPSIWSLQGSIYPKGTDYYVAETPGYNQQDTAKATALLKEAGYDGRPLRILTITTYAYSFNLVQVAAANLQDAGFKVDVQVMDLPTFFQKRADERNWEAICISGSMAPDPSLFSILNPAYPGWWDTPRKRTAFDKFLGATSEADRIAAWRQLHALFYEELPTVMIGAFYALYGISNKLSGFTSFGWPCFWNVRLIG